MSPFAFVIALTGIVLTYKLAVEFMRRRDAGEAEDGKILQEIHRALSRLEERVEALETLVIDKTRAAEFERRLSS